MRTLLAFCLALLTGGSLGSLLSPKLSNQHLRLSDSQQQILLLPFKNTLQDQVGTTSLKIVQSSIFVAGSSTLSVTFIVTDKTHMSNDYVKFHAYLDLDDLSAYEVSFTNGQQKFIPTLKIENSHDQLMAAKDIDSDFRQYLSTFGLSEAAQALDGEKGAFLKRYLIFAKNTIRAAWMTVVEQGSATYGITQFSDLETEEFAKFYKLPQGMLKNYLETEKQWNFKPAQRTLTNEPAPEDFDWRQKNAVTDVKNQGMCGSCWSFSTTGNIEGVHAVATGELISLSEQELVDCDKTDQGCNGGLMDNAFEQIEELGGLEKEEDYAYTAHAGKCLLDKSKIAVNISGYHDVPIGDEEAMRDQLLETGPLAVALNAMWMQFYRGGVSHPWKRLCSPKMLDHGVLIVGYGVEPANPDHVPFPKKEQPFWTIKNSWGPGWGEHGYYRLYRGDGTCGIDQYVTTAEA